MFECRVQTEDFEAGALIRTLAGQGTHIGAVATFIGYMRSQNEGNAVFGMHLEHYPGMTEKVLGDILKTAQTRWPLQAAQIVHRVGALKPGEQIVFVGVASAHRKAAFEACEFIMDFLKTQAPFWKQETTPEGARWVDARESDDLAKQRWEK